MSDRAGLDAVKAALARMGAVEVCRRLNLDRPSVATGGGLLVLCPWHGAVSYTHLTLPTSDLV